MRLVLLGAPGSGKGTQGRALGVRFGLPTISAGDVLRARAAADRQTGSELAAVLDRGDLVPDDAVLSALRDGLTAAAAAGGYVLEGFPRRLSQARQLETVAAPDTVVYLDVPDEVARRRLAGRAVEGRTDDVPATIERRLGRFHHEIEPLRDFYARRGILTTVDADRPSDIVTADILEALAERPRQRIP